MEIWMNRKSYNKRRIFYIIYRNVEKKHPDWLRDEVRSATIGLLASRAKRAN
jgi:hypothetical protein